MPRLPLLRPVTIAAALAATLLGPVAPPAAAYDVVGPRWEDSDITWRIVDYSRQASLRGKQPAVERVIASAMRQWEKSSRNIRFRKVRGGAADIEVRFASRGDGTGSPFDGPGGIAAYAYFPPNGDLLFDDDETWSLNRRSRARAADGTGHRPERGGERRAGLDLYQSAIHELGHSLGLGHSNDPRSVMRADVTNRWTLGWDDVRAVHALYGWRAAQPQRDPRDLRKGVADFTVPPSR